MAFKRNGWSWWPVFSQTERTRHNFSKFRQMPRMRNRGVKSDSHLCMYAVRRGVQGRERGVHNITCHMLHTSHKYVISTSSPVARAANEKKCLQKANEQKHTFPHDEYTIEKRVIQAIIPHLTLVVHLFVMAKVFCILIVFSVF